MRRIQPSRKTALTRLKKGIATHDEFPVGQFTDAIRRIAFDPKQGMTVIESGEEPHMGSDQGRLQIAGAIAITNEEVKCYQSCRHIRIHMSDAIELRIKHVRQINSRRMQQQTRVGLTVTSSGQHAIGYWDMQGLSDP